MWLDPDKTLLEHRNVDTWQLPVVNSKGAYFGNVVSQIVEPEQAMVRYFLVYSANEQRHFLLPSDVVTQIEADKIYCELSTNSIQQLPQYTQEIDRDQECKIYQAIAKTPYWEYEH